MKICREEIFGPVQVIQKFKTIEEVIERANRYIFQLMISKVSSCTQKDTVLLLFVR
jgi:acyl-CoA reductase-like NAD-dependent aldehyde dehydrogenase